MSVPDPPLVSDPTLVLGVSSFAFLLRRWKEKLIVHLALFNQLMLRAFP